MTKSTYIRSDIDSPKLDRTPLGSWRKVWEMLWKHPRPPWVVVHTCVHTVVVTRKSTLWLTAWTATEDRRDELPIRLLSYQEPDRCVGVTIPSAAKPDSNMKHQLALLTKLTLPRVAVSPNILSTASRLTVAELVPEPSSKGETAEE
jgi:hypothetical protein